MHNVLSGHLTGELPPMCPVSTKNALKQDMVSIPSAPNSAEKAIQRSPDPKTLLRISAFGLNFRPQTADLYIPAFHAPTPVFNFPFNGFGTG